MVLGPQPNPFRLDIANALGLNFSDSNPLPTFKNQYVSYLTRFQHVVMETKTLLGDILQYHPSFKSPLVSGQDMIANYNIADISELITRVTQ